MVALTLSIIGVGVLVAIFGVGLHCLGRRDRARRAAACQLPVTQPGPLPLAVAVSRSPAGSIHPGHARVEASDSGYEWPGSLTRGEPVSPFGQASVFYSASSQVLGVVYLFPGYCVFNL